VLRLPVHAYPVTYLFRFRGPRYPPRFVSHSLRWRSQKVQRVPSRPGSLFNRRPKLPGLLSRGHERDLPGSQAIHPVPLPRSRTPAEPTTPRLLTVSSMLPPLPSPRGLQPLEISGLPRGFSTCCLRFTNGVATIHAKLASGWLARLYREGVEPSGSLQKVSDHSLVLLFWIYPGARRTFLHLSYSYASPCGRAMLVTQG
jgi:hypothetical protein